MILLVLALRALQSSQRNGYRLSQANRLIEHRKQMNQQQAMHTMERLQHIDPNFSAKAYEKAIESAFWKVQVARQDQKLHAIQHFIADGLSANYTAQFQEQQRLGYREKIDHTLIHSIRFKSFESTGAFDVLTVELNSSSTEYRVSLNSGAYLSGDRKAATRIEYWTLVRAHGAKPTAALQGLEADRCPNCNAAIAIDSLGHCLACNAAIRSGQYGWVLLEIVQAGESGQPDANTLENIQRYQSTKDPYFNVQHIHDRTAVVFWRKVTADREGQVAYLHKFASPDFCQNYQQHLQFDHEDKRSFFGDCKLGRVSVLGVIEDTSVDYCIVQVQSFAYRYSQHNGDLPQKRPKWHRRSHLMIWMRKHDVTTHIERCLCSLHCPHCGAPDESFADPICSSCSQPLNLGDYDWILVDYLPFNSSAAKRWRKRLFPQLSSYCFNNTSLTATSIHHHEPLTSVDAFAWIINIMLVDDSIDETEQATLQEMAQRSLVSQAVLEHMIKKAKKRELVCPSPKSYRQCRNWLKAMIAAAYCDGVVTKFERALLEKLGKTMDFGKADIDILIKQHQTHLLQSTRNLAACRI